MSQEIFKLDPFLLRAESQREYGRTLLKNILVRRTSMSGRTRIVDLFDQSVSDAGNSTPERPSNDVADRYLKSRIERRNLLSEAERDHLKQVTMLCRGERTERRLRDLTDQDGKVYKEKFATHASAQDELAGKNVDINRRLRIAAVGVRVKVSKLIGAKYLDEDLCLINQLPRPQRIVGLPDDCGISELGRTVIGEEPDDQRWKRWADTVCGHLGVAVESGSQVVVLPEFALPPEAESVGLECQILDQFAPLAERGTSHFIFAGSRHEGGVNRGLVRYVKSGEAAHPTEWHYKVASARALGENVLGPRSDIYSTYDAQLEADGRPYPIHATIAICYDTFDPSTFLSLVFNAATREALEVPQIILVPSFNPSEDFVQMLRDLSFLTASTVIYVNSLHGDARAFVAVLRGR